MAYIIILLILIICILAIALYRTRTNLLKSDEFQTSLYNNIPGVLYRCSYNKDWTMEFISDEIEHLSGYLPKDFINDKVRTFASIIHPDDKTRVERIILESIKNKKTYSLRYRIIDKENNVKHVLEKGRGNFDRKGDLQSLDGAIFDVTKQKETEQKLFFANAEAKKALKIKSEFLANMSHEIRTPMNGIIGMTKLVQDTKLDDQQKDYIDSISDCGESLLSIINDILDFSKIEAGKLDIAESAIEVTSFFKNILSIFEHMAKEKNLSIEVNIDSKVPEIIVSDPVRLRQIIVNLIGNALKFTNQGEVIIEVNVSNDDLLEIKVKDTGIGIAKNIQSKLFNEFTQADSTITKKYGGTGLGLSICKKLTSLMGGKISVHSDLGKGSTFTFTITKKVGNKAKLSNDKEVSGDFTFQLGKNYPLKILIVEDSAINRKLLSAILLKLGYQSEFAFDGKEAIEALVYKKYDLLFMDMQMPRMGGIEATQIINKEYAEGRPIIVALTANVFQEDIDRCLDAGMDDFISKPISIKVLKTILRKYGMKINSKNEKYVK
ncbi:MAG: response regulator [Halobacteriovoraceae bacterium]|nr:response regulator [Halobacteriovoraceae bacterium]